MLTTKMTDVDCRLHAYCRRSNKPTVGSHNLLAWAIIALLVASLGGCMRVVGGQQTILISLTPTAAAAVQLPKQPDPFNTGIPSLDVLNRFWQVQQMMPVFPDISPNDVVAIQQGLAGIYKLTVPPGTNLDLMIQAYRVDPNITYAEINQEAEVK